ncbi:MAG: GAF domain-containing protein [Undibacterium sp.]|nr:GAF domain-containing protein [Undibacterium sp.]
MLSSCSGLVHTKLDRLYQLLIAVSLTCLSSLATGEATPSPTSSATILGAPFITNYDAKTYKAHSQNWVSVQDQRGIIYFGNSSGLLEFDGQRWKNISLTGNPMIRALAIASDQTIYYGSIGDFGYLSVDKKGKIQSISLRDQIPKNEASFNDVWQIEATSHGVYFLTRSRIFRLFQGQISALDGKFASSQAVVIDDHLVYIDSKLGLSIIDEGKIIPLPEFAQVANGKRVVLAQFAPHQILAGRVSGDFLLLDFTSLWNAATKKYRPDASQLKPDMVRKFTTDIDSMVDTEKLFLYKMIPAGELFALSTVKGGILLLNRQGKVQRALNRNAGLIDNTVAGIMMDHANNLWASTNSGISYVELSVPQSRFGASNGIEGISISSIYHQGQFYVGTYQHLLKLAPYQYGVKQDAPQFIPIQDSPSEIWQFKEVAGDLMVVSGRGLYKIIDDKAYRVADSGVGGYALGSSQRWPDHLFMGKMGGLEIFQREHGNWKFLGAVSDIPENIRRITADSSGDLWLSTEVQGLIRMHFTGNDPRQVLLQHIGVAHGLPELASNRANFINDTLFSASAKGIYSAPIAAWLDSKEMTHFKPDARFGEQFSNGSLPIIEIQSNDAGGYILRTTEDVRWIQKNKNGTFQMNDQAFRGLPQSSEALYVHPDGSVWMPGENLYRIEPNAHKNYAQAFSAMIRKVSANTKELIFDGAYGAQGKMIANAETVFQASQEARHTPQLLYQQNALMFEFSASFYEKPSSTQFQYQLEGFDKNWSGWSQVSSKEYTNIPEGQYRFKVRAKNVYGTLTEEVSYQFTLLPPWYRSNWAYALWTLLIATVSLGGIHLYTMHLRANKRKLEKEIIERTSEAILQKDAADRARHKISLLAEMGRQITASLDTQAIEKNLYLYVQELIPGNTFGIGIVDWTRRVIRFDYVIENHRSVQAYQRSLEASEQPATQCVLSAKELLVDDLVIDTRELDRFIGRDFDNKQISTVDGSASPRPRSALYVPIILKDQVMGVISVQSDEPNIYNDNDIDILRSLGSYAAVALDNANSYQRLQLAQNKLVEQEKLAALGSLVAGVAHELNTPIGNSLLTASSLDELSDQLLDEVHSGSIKRSRLLHFSSLTKNACELLIRNLSNAAELITSFKQIAVDQTSDKRRQFNLKTVTTEIVSTLAGRLRREQHQVHIQIPENIEMDSYPGPYGQVITNMIINALVHAFDKKNNGEIRITAELINALQVKIQISDNGNGISESNLNRIFDPFFTTRMGQGGSGLGLHISYNIITAILGGSIEVRSQIGSGTSFELILPVAAPALIVRETDDTVEELG